MTSRNILTIAFILIFVGFSCKKKSTAIAPETPILLFPVKDEVCLTGVNISPSQNSVGFRWAAAANTDSYEITVKNLITNSLTTQPVTGTTINLILARNTPYSWYVISRSAITFETSKSEIWKFYNSGPDIKAYTPYPAEVITPLNGQIVSIVNNTIILDWSSSDADNDIINHDIYFGTVPNPPLHSVNIIPSVLANVPVLPKTSYYWKIVTRDSKGNLSDSGVYQFTTN